jgi:hypothetical protein
MIRGIGDQVDDVQAIGIDFQRGRLGPRRQRLHQMRPDLGRLDAEILQIRPFLGHGLEKWKPVFGKDHAQEKDERRV